jgi:putative addiction module CopG family antidote
MAGRTTMNVSVTPELESFVKGLVESGQYQSASDVFRAGLRELREKERLRQLEEYVLHGVETGPQVVPVEMLKAVRADLRSKIEAGIDSLERREFVDSKEAFARWRRRLDSVVSEDEVATRLVHEAG